MLELLWRDDVVVVVSPLLGVVAALNEELAWPVATDASLEGNTFQSAWHDTWYAQGAHFLGCTCLWVKVDSSLGHDGRFVRHAGPDPSSGLGLARHGAG